MKRSQGVSSKELSQMHSRRYPYFHFFILSLFYLLICQPNISHVRELRVWVSPHGLHLHGLASPTEEEETAGYAMHNDVERVARMYLAYETVCAKAAGERQPGVAIREAGQRVGAPRCNFDYAVAHHGAYHGLRAVGRAGQFLQSAVAYAQRACHKQERVALSRQLAHP